MVRCPQCNMILTSVEAKADRCPICRGELGGSLQGSRQVEAEDSSGSPTPSMAPSSEPAESGTSRRAAWSIPKSPPKLILWAVLGVWCLATLLWLAPGDTLRLPPRLLGVLLLASPLLLASKHLLAKRETEAAT